MMTRAQTIIPRGLVTQTTANFYGPFFASRKQSCLPGPGYAREAGKSSSSIPSCGLSLSLIHYHAFEMSFPAYAGCPCSRRPNQRRVTGQEAAANTDRRVEPRRHRRIHANLLEERFAALHWQVRRTPRLAGNPEKLQERLPGHGRHGPPVFRLDRGQETVARILLRGGQVDVVPQHGQPERALRPADPPHRGAMDDRCRPQFLINPSFCPKAGINTGAARRR